VFGGALFFFEGGDIGFAFFDGHMTARVEGAAGGGMDGAGYFAPEFDAPAGAAWFGSGDGGKQGHGVRMFGVAVDFIGPGVFDDAAEVHDGDIVANVFDDGEIMGDEEIGQAELSLEVRQEINDLGLNRDVQGADRLIADDKPGIQGEGTGDADALALAAGEFVRVAAGVAG